VPPIQSAIGDADESDVEEHDHKIVHNVQKEHPGQEQRRLVWMELFAGSQGRGCGRAKAGTRRQMAIMAVTMKQETVESTGNSIIACRNEEWRALLDELPATRELTHRTLPIQLETTDRY